MHIVNSSPRHTGQPHLQTQPAPWKWTQMYPNGHIIPSTWAPLEQASPRGLHWLVPLEWTRSVWKFLPPSLSWQVFLLGWFSTLLSLQSFLAAGIIQMLFVAPRTWTIRARTELIHWDMCRAHFIQFLWPVNLREVFWDKLSAAQTVTVSHSSSTKTRVHFGFWWIALGVEAWLPQGVWLLFKDGSSSGVWDLLPEHELGSVIHREIGKIPVSQLHSKNTFFCQCWENVLTKNCFWAQHNGH